MSRAFVRIKIVNAQNKTVWWKPQHPLRTAVTLEVFDLISLGNTRSIGKHNLLVGDSLELSADVINEKETIALINLVKED